MAGDKQHTVLKPHGYAVFYDPELGTKELDTLQCVHCGCHFAVLPGSGRQRGWCLLCQGPTCDPACSKECVPYEQWLDNLAKGLPENWRPTVVLVDGQVPGS